MRNRQKKQVIIWGKVGKLESWKVGILTAQQTTNKDYLTRSITKKAETEPKKEEKSNWKVGKE